MSRPEMPQRKPSRLVRAITNPNEYLAAMVPQPKDRNPNAKKLEDSKLARAIGGVNLDYGLREPDRPKDLPSADEPLADILVDKTVELKLPPGYRIRSMQRGDLGRGFSKLKTLGLQPSPAAWIDRCEFLRDRSDTYIVLVITDVEGMVVCSGTLVIERKFSHGLSLMGRVDELAVGDGQSGLNLGLRMLEALEGIAKERGCYKSIVTAPEVNEGFYRQKGELLRRDYAFRASHLSRSLTIVMSRLQTHRCRAVTPLYVAYCQTQGC